MKAEERPITDQLLLNPLKAPNRKVKYYEVNKTKF